MADCVCVLCAQWGRWVLAAFNRLAISPSSTNTRQAHTHKTWLDCEDIHTNTQKHMHMCTARECVTWHQEKMAIKTCGHALSAVRLRFREWTAYCQECSSLSLAWCQHPFQKQWCLTVVDRPAAALGGGDGPFKQVAGNQKDRGWIAAAREDRMRGDRKQKRNNEHHWIISFVIHTNSKNNIRSTLTSNPSEDFERWRDSKTCNMYSVYLSWPLQLQLLYYGMFQCLSEMIDQSQPLLKNSCAIVMLN